jgi:hypothetical protein
VHGLTTDDLGVVADFSGSLSPSDCDGQLIVTVGEAMKLDVKARTHWDITSCLPESAGGALGEQRCREYRQK